MKMKTYEVVEHISPKTARHCIICFETDKEMREYLEGKREYNAGNKQYSIIAWTIPAPECYINFGKYGYTEA